uniref:non-specific serine/threonine protein kinase n=1 Tax=Seriola lalandi dorsalis TaxID=1841481 RepID=A0A3B4Y9A5_SERLL
KAKYKQQKQLGEGGCGSVFAGYRKADHLPVSDTHTCSCTHKHTHTPYGHNVLIKVLFVSLGTSAPVSLLDWYDLGQKLILVLERPVPCEDLFTYLEVKRGTIQEEEAKVSYWRILCVGRQLWSRIFHRDIKLENILIETGSDVPRVRLIDFGLSCFFKKRSVFQDFYGTCDHIPPEYYSHFTYSASPTTVWQVGVVLFEIRHLPHLTPNLESFSPDCQDFLKMCLTKLPARRPTLEQLQLHPWIIYEESKDKSSENKTLPCYVI